MVTRPHGLLLIGWPNHTSISAKLLSPECGLYYINDLAQVTIEETPAHEQANNDSQWW